VGVVQVRLIDGREIGSGVEIFVEFAATNETVSFDLAVALRSEGKASLVNKRKNG
jgi:hypothetical protein